LFGVYAGYFRFRKEYAAAKVLLRQDWNGIPRSLQRDEFTMAERFTMLPAGDPVRAAAYPA